MTLLLIKLLAWIGNVRLVHITGSRLVTIEDEIEGKVLAPAKTAEIIVALQQENERLTRELYYCQKGLD